MQFVADAAHLGGGQSFHEARVIADAARCRTAQAQEPPSPVADTAHILGIEPEIDRLRMTEDKCERLALHQEIAELVQDHWDYRTTGSARA